MIARGKRIVQCRARPVVDGAGTEGNIALEIARARDARRGILGVQGNSGAEEQRERSGE